MRNETEAIRDELTDWNRAQMEICRAREFINAAPTPGERAARKAFLYHVLYSGPTPMRFSFLL